MNVDGVTQNRRNSLKHSFTKFFSSTNESSQKHLHNPQNYYGLEHNTPTNDENAILSTVSSGDTHVHPVQELQKQIEYNYKNHAIATTTITPGISPSNHDVPSKNERKYTKGKKSLKLKRFFKIDLFGDSHTDRSREDKDVSTGMLVTTNQDDHSLTYKTLYESDNIKDLMKQYGTPLKKLGEGATGSVSVVKNSNTSKLYAIKVFTSTVDVNSGKNFASFSKKVTAEFCIGSILKHQNVIEVMDMMQQDEGGFFILVMEYAPYDFFDLVMSNMMTVEEVDCYFKQLCNGVNYVHSMGIAHRDLKLDNCVVDNQGILKIIDFGSAAIFKNDLNDMSFMKTYGVVGSDPYLAPELVDNTCTGGSPGYYDPRPVDVWAIAIIYYALIKKKFPWKSPRLIYNSFRLFSTKPKNPNDTTMGPNYLLKHLPENSKDLLRDMFEIDPIERIIIDHIVKDPWFLKLECCTLDKHGNLVRQPENHKHHFLEK